MLEHLKFAEVSKNKSASWKGFGLQKNTFYFLEINQAEKALAFRKKLTATQNE